MPETVQSGRERTEQAPRATSRGHQDSRWPRLIAVSVAVLLAQGAGLVYLAVTLKRSTESLLQTQVALMDRLTRMQEAVAQVSEAQETLQLLVADQQRNLADTVDVQRAWRQAMEDEQRAAGGRLTAVESHVQAVERSYEEFRSLLVAAEATWKDLAGHLATYRREMEAMIDVMDRRSRESGMSERRVPDSTDHSLRLPRGITSPQATTSVRER